MSDAEESFAYHLRVLAPELTAPRREYVFAPPRKWRFDFAWVEDKAAVEIDGGAFIAGRHTRGAGFERDHEKMNAAQMAGWRVLRFTPQMLRRDPQSCIEQVRALVRLPFTEKLEAVC